MSITGHGEYAQDKGLDVESAIYARMDEKAEEFHQSGSQIYQS